MTTVNPAAQPGTSQQAVVEAALLLLERMGLSPADLAASPPARRPGPTFAEYVPGGSAAVRARAGRAAAVPGRHRILPRRKQMSSDTIGGSAGSKRSPM